MSCGHPHETPCSEVLGRIYWYLDGEVSAEDCDHIRQHLDECGPCLREYGLDKVVKQLIATHCGCDPAPSDLRGKVLVRIRQVQAELGVTELEVTE
jgi:mycothiol system anti-sigma-R factor